MPLAQFTWLGPLVTGTALLQVLSTETSQILDETSHLQDLHPSVNELEVPLLVVADLHFLHSQITASTVKDGTEVLHSRNAVNVVGGSRAVVVPGEDLLDEAEIVVGKTVTVLIFLAQEHPDHQSMIGDFILHLADDLDR
ncbi:uncharacterized protein N7511_000187 [Penicillium nucicola]|uniref:uncharacterized protein n=1 Tax=Penicillium nucicola TaxID=1850975 RepID=UPI0025452E2F|nr:uncharacterized protein N7511_000187 [Penicillium nucicola]KAJ5775176.1 hypothetical protein N7511_000187 [Penicillium nucicola]